MAHVARESKLSSVVRSFMHPCPGNCVLLEREVVYNAQVDHAFSAGIKRRHCMYPEKAGIMHSLNSCLDFL